MGGIKLGCEIRRSETNAVVHETEPTMEERSRLIPSADASRSTETFNFEQVDRCEQD